MMKIAKMIKKCLVCGEEFKTYPSKIKLGRGKYCSKKCCLIETNKKLVKNGKETRWQKGQKPASYKGFRLTQSRKVSKKYKEIYKPNHPYSTKAGYVREHRLIMENLIGRYLDKSEIVHHIDGDGLNNKIENLILMNKIDHDRMNVNLNVHLRWKERTYAE